jgi:hypothetical protein
MEPGWGRRRRVDGLAGVIYSKSKYNAGTRRSFALCLLHTTPFDTTHFQELFYATLWNMELAVYLRSAFSSCADWKRPGTLFNTGSGGLCGAFCGTLGGTCHCDRTRCGSCGGRS